MRNVRAGVIVVCVAFAVLGIGCSDTGGFDAAGDARTTGDAIVGDAIDDLADAVDIVSRDVPPLDGSGDGAAGDASTDGASDASGGDGSDCGTPVTAVPYASHTMNEEFTDPPSCTRCSGMFTGLDTLSRPLAPTATTLTISGASPGATGCEWYVLGGSCGVTHGILATDPDGAGMFTATVPVFCGTNVVQIVCSTSAGRRVYVRRLEGTMCPSMGRDLRVTLTWDNQGTDMELHLVRPGGHINVDPDDCTWFTCVSRSPMWGPLMANNPRKDVDNVTFYGPENIFLDAAPAGTYHVLVEFWGGGNPSTNVVDIAIRERTVAHLTRPSLPVHWVWYVGDVTFPAGTFRAIDTTTDCTTRWRGTTMGCDMPLP